MTSSGEFIDLLDFFERWPATRSTILALLNSDHVSQQEREILNAMVFVVDRVGPDDLEP
ncbi:MAG: hypothetical protein AAGF36_06960 [Pseudomonadota bacterium]